MSDLIGRVKGVLLSPKDELPKMVADPGELKAVLVPYVAVLAAIAPVASFLSTGLIGVYHAGIPLFGIPSGWTRMPIMGLFSSIISYCISIGSWWFLGFILTALAPSFGGRKDSGGGFKAAAAIATPICVAGALGILNSVPMMGWLSIIASIGALVYSVFIAIWAVPDLMGTPKEKAVGHALASLGIVLGAIIVLSLIVGAILTAVFLSAAGGLGRGLLH